MISLDQGRPQRDYASIARSLSTIEGDRDARMRAAADALWDALSHLGVSWIGFYLGEEERMVLGPARDKPACSPIELHGMCGLSYRTKEAIVVRDVRTLGNDYIACDPRDLSEVVVPLFDADGTCWGVLDADSYDVGAFDAADAVALAEIMALAGLSASTDEPLRVRTL